MILDYLNGQYDLIITKVMLIFFTWLIVLLAITIDLIFGVKKSKEENLYISSIGLRRTVTKIINYLGMMVFMMMFDAISPLGLLHSNFNILPLSSVIGCIILVYIEFKSVREKSENKFRNQTTKAVAEILEAVLDDESILNKVKDKFKQQ